MNEQQQQQHMDHESPFLQVVEEGSMISGIPRQMLQSMAGIPTTMINNLNSMAGINAMSSTNMHLAEHQQNHMLQQIVNNHSLLREIPVSENPVTLPEPASSFISPAMQYAIDNQKRPRANLSWNVMFDLLVQYGLDHNDHNVPKSGVVHLLDGAKVNLGQWLKSQRKLRRTRKLQPQREAMLQTLIDKGTLFWDSNWKEAHDDIWERNFSALLDFGKVHGHCNVPTSYSFASGEESVQLGAWLKEQHKTKRANKLGAERSAKFQKLVDDGLLAWEKDTSPAARASEWRRYFTSLLAYGAMNADYNVPKNYIGLCPDDGSMVYLGKWLRDQRQAHRAGKLPFETLTSLQQLVNQGKLSWEDENDVLAEFASNQQSQQLGRQIPDDVFDSEHASKRMRVDEFSTEISDAAYVVASMGHIDDAVAYAEEAIQSIQ